MRPHCLAYINHCLVAPGMRLQSSLDKHKTVQFTTVTYAKNNIQLEARKVEEKKLRSKEGWEGDMI